MTISREDSHRLHVTNIFMIWTLNLSIVRDMRRIKYLRFVCCCSKVDYGVQAGVIKSTSWSIDIWHQKVNLVQLMTQLYILMFTEALKRTCLEQQKLRCCKSGSNFVVVEMCSKAIVFRKWWFKGGLIVLQLCRWCFSWNLQTVVQIEGPLPFPDTGTVSKERGYTLVHRMRTLNGGPLSKGY